MMKSDTDDFRQSLQPMLVNRDHEKELLSICPHRDITEEISCIVVSSHTHTPVDYQTAAEHCMTGAEILDRAIQNQGKTTYCLSAVENVLGNSAEETESPSSLLVLTNKQSFWGSSEVLNEAAMEDAATRLRSEKIFVIPSSIHEVLLFPEEGGVSATQFNALIDHVNQSEVAPRDRLASRAMLYDSRSHRLADAEEMLREKTASEMQPPSPERRHHV
ncbi:DUF5688 family protein [Bacillota bacterium HCP28S3_F12]